MAKTNWILCPICGNKTRDRIREDTILKNYPLYCPKCKQETLIIGIKADIVCLQEVSDVEKHHRFLTNEQSLFGADAFIPLFL